jgi:hypothetical protein
MQAKTLSILEDVELNIQLDQLRSRGTQGITAEPRSARMLRPGKSMRKSTSTTTTSLLKSPNKAMNMTNKSEPTEVTAYDSTFNPRVCFAEPSLATSKTSPTASLRRPASASSRQQASQVSRSDTGVYFQQTKLKEELNDLQLDVSIFHEAKIMQTYFEDLVTEANSFCRILEATKNIHYELLLPEELLENSKKLRDAVAYWNDLKYELKEQRKSESLNPLLRRIPTGTAKQLKYMHVLKISSSSTLQMNVKDTGSKSSEPSDASIVKQIISMDSFVKEHKSLRLQVDKLSSLRPQQEKNYNINHCYIHGSGGVRSDQEFEAAANSDTGFRAAKDVKPAITSSDDENDAVHISIGTDTGNDVTRDELMAKLKTILESCVDKTKILESQIFDINVRGWNALC